MSARAKTIRNRHTRRMLAPTAPGRAGRISVALIDVHTLFRQGLAVLLRSEPDLTVVGEASGGDAAIELARRTQPDIILADVQLPGTQPEEAVRRLAAAAPNSRIIVLTATRQDLVTMLRAVHRNVTPPPPPP